jgi:hypothetical protein
VRTAVSLSAVLTTVVLLTLLPQYAEAGPCSTDIAGLEAAIRLVGGSLPAQPNQPAPDLARRWHIQFSATMARAKRLDADGDRFGCIGALNAARGMSVLVARQ